MSVAFDALRQTGQTLRRHTGMGLMELRGTLRDSATGAATLLRNAARIMARANGETKAVALLCLGLTVLVAMPKPAIPSAPDAVSGGDAPQGASPTPAEPPYAREPWRAVAPKLASWRLEAPQLASAGSLNRLRTLPDGSRQDLLVWPAAAGDRLTGALSIERYLDAAPEADSLYVETARRAALAGASIERMAQGAILETKFGTFDSADTLIDAGRGPQPCIAFRQIAAEAPARISGWFCGGEHPLDRVTLACILNRLDLVGSGDDGALRGWFATAERNRRGCETSGTGSARWMDPGARLPPLKRDVSPRPAQSSGRSG